MVIGPYPAQGGAARTRDPSARLAEAVGLAQAIDLDVIDQLALSLNEIRPATYLGKGKVEEIAEIVRAKDAALVSMDCQLSPVQQRNLEKAWDAKVIDREGSFSKSSESAPAPRKARCRWSSPIWPIRSRDSCAPGPISNASAAASAFSAARAKRKSRRTGA